MANGRGNCTPHRNPTPCTIPQDKESIFHSIFAFFTKSGRKVLVNIQPPCCTLTFQRSLRVTPCEDSCFDFLLVGVTSVYHTSFFLLRSFSNAGLRSAWKSVHDDLLQPGSTVKRRSFEHRYKTFTQHWNPQDGEGSKFIRRLPWFLKQSIIYNLSTHRILPLWSSLSQGAMCK